MWTDICWVRKHSEWEEEQKRITGIPLASTPDKFPLVNGDPDSIPVLIELVKQVEDNHARLVALCGLEMIGPPAREAIPVLVPLLLDKDDFQWEAWQALVSIDPEGGHKRPTFTLSPEQVKEIFGEADTAVTANHP
jgi:hypothetical protein